MNKDDWKHNLEERVVGALRKYYAQRGPNRLHAEDVERIKKNNLHPPKTFLDEGESPVSKEDADILTLV